MNGPLSRQNVRETTTYFLLACEDVTFDDYEVLLSHLVHVHKICRRFYDSTQVKPQVDQPQPISRAEPEDIDPDGDEAANVTTPEAISEVVEIDPQVS